ncbi:matrixin family metalloprotease [Bowmanella yangjiangensis]|uniref:Matrixin family metalloprotease n=1 Tax=Bowmanella yangjiangensis TaxID=2811230 RepID=A0ABS3CPA3_9ALTE|nr:matrixin family metalloprotease [Bowmanella yangjiangensis]MBN7818535.1 matrixin family metalloprotease [Bowmanella yangjiangensis]
MFNTKIHSLKSLTRQGLCLLLVCISGFANAAYITIDETGMDAIFSQASFGNTPVDIRIGPSVQHVDASLLNMDTAGKWATLTGAHYGAANVVNFWFLDDLTWCGNINPGYVGCGETPGNDFVVESVFADSGFNAELLAHELGHNLGLGHSSGATNLMDPFINGGTDLSAAEVATILASGLIQTDTAGRLFIEIIPVLIVAAAEVPVVPPLLLMLIGLMMFPTLRRRA